MRAAGFHLHELAQTNETSRRTRCLLELQVRFPQKKRRRPKKAASSRGE
jgi:hypothetical protein